MKIGKYVHSDYYYAKIQFLIFAHFKLVTDLSFFRH